MFKLSDILPFDNIVIQCHDNPDADAIGSAFALYSYLRQQGKSPEIVYSGFNEVSKRNLQRMLSDLAIPMRYVKELEAPDLLVCVDCQYGQGNVKKFAAPTVCVVDHHLLVSKEYDFGVVESGLGSCSTLMWKLLSDEGFDFAAQQNVATALYYGLFTDTSKLTEINHPLDKDMRDSLPTFANMTLIKELRNCNLSLEELEVAGVALLRNHNDSDKRYAIFRAEDCDPSILAMISDFALEVENVDVCLAYNIKDDGAKTSVRSCVREVMASEFAEFISSGVGSGGGHRDKAGGFIQKKAVEALEMSIPEYISLKSAVYFEKYDMIYASNHTIDTSDMKRYVKKPLHLGFVISSEVFEKNTSIMLRTLEGDSKVRSDDDIYLMIGIEGEIYPIKADKFRANYKICECDFCSESEYEPSAKNESTGEVKKLKPFIKSCISLGEKPIFARPLTRHTKVFTEWNPDGYMYGKPGDYLAVKCDDINDVYIIQAHIFAKAYEEVV